MNNIRLEGINILWWPVIAFWKIIWSWFTPGYWTFAWRIWSTGAPLILTIIVGIIVTILSALLYIVIIVVLLILFLVFALLVSIAWFIAAIGNGIFHFAINPIETNCGSPKLNGV